MVATRSQPPEHHPVEPRATRAATAPTTMRSPAGSARRPQPTAALRGCRPFHDGWVDGGLRVDRHRLPDVRHHRPTSASTASRAGHATAHPVRVQPCDGQLATARSPTTGTSSPPRRGLQGGFIWEWKDHGIRQRPARRHGRASPTAVSSATRRTTATSSPTGWSAADLEPHPAMREVAWVYRPVTVAAVGRKGALRIANRQSFTGLDWLAAPTWELLVDGGVVAAAARSPSRMWRRTRSVDVAAAVRRAGRRRRGAADDAVPQLAPTTSWAPAGHLVAWDQVELQRPRPPTLGASPSAPSSRPVERLARSARCELAFPRADRQRRVQVDARARSCESASAVRR